MLHGALESSRRPHRHVLNNREGLKVAVIVNDMADVNVDANLLMDVVQAEEKMVALSNGCICCTLREDLFVEIAKLASKPDGLDHILIESSGISEPLPVAETFTFKDAAGTSLGSIAKLDTLVTVVDGSSFMDELMAGGALKLEWLQIKIEMDTDIEEHKFGMVEQCQKLLKLDAATEEALVKQYPQPELLLPKVEPRSKEERAARKKPPKATGAEKAALEAKFCKKKKRGKKGRA